MADKNCKKCKYFNAYIAGNSKYVTLECPYKEFHNDTSQQIISTPKTNKTKFSRYQAELFFEILSEECMYYDEVNKNT